MVIVESPAKAKTIGKYLGPDYQVTACMGHLRDLPKSTLGVDIEHDFEPDYKPIRGKEELIRELKKAAAASDTVYLATDPDREGEAISWHLQHLLGLADDKTKRVTFNEITRKVVNESIAHPRTIDQNLVDAQQARRVLDRVVGYQISPVMWKKIRRGLSAGRVQSVATRMVADRDQEIADFRPQEYWTLDALLENGEKAAFHAHYYGQNGKKYEPQTQADVQAIMDELRSAAFAVKSVKRTDKNRSPAPPFTTSTMQQEASRKLNMTPRRTMAIAQQLYEGVDITGEGTVGLITYMRTDSLRISEEALAAAGSVIRSRYGDAYASGEPRRYKPKSGAQDAHEAIRPSNVALYPEMVEHDLTKEQFRLYKLIWSRFIASQMANALYDVTAIEAACGRHVFRATHQSMKFSGFTAIYEEGRDDEQEKLDSPLPDLTPGEALTAAGFDKQQHFTQPPARYTEASLVRAMEEKGVGRPSTYAAIIATIQDREYVVKTDKKLSPTKLGEVVNGLMMDRFPNIISVEFTADMEKQLDQVEAGQRRWKNVLEEFYTDFHQEMLDAEEALKDTRLKVPDEVSEEKCEICGRNLVVKTSRFGKFLACPGYPECKFTKAITEKMPGRCPKCGSAILKRKSKRGYAYYACERGTACGFMTWDVPTDQDCPVCGQTMFKRSGKGAMKPFCANPECSNFLPEDKRGYRRRSTASGEAATAESNAEAAAEAAQKQAEEKKAAKKPAAKKTAEKPAAKKTAAKKPAAKKTTAKRSTAKKTTKKEEPEDDLPF
ncbi:MAG: type I DNA topoisomerase [Clostridiales bacterium]|nr:type I DNA topoisomerase [Clostridiales bacterium]